MKSLAAIAAALILSAIVAWMLIRPAWLDNLAVRRK